MSEQELEKALHKLIDSLVIKGRIDFSVEISEYFNSYSEKTYTIYVTIDNDHSKYWRSSPNYSEEYYEMITNLDTYLEDEVYSLSQYVITDEIVVKIVWEHSGTDVYEPLFDLMGELKIPFAVKYSTYVPNLSIIIDDSFSDKNFGEIHDELNKSFDTDDIAMWYQRL